MSRLPIRASLLLAAFALTAGMGLAPAPRCRRPGEDGEDMEPWLLPELPPLPSDVEPFSSPAVAAPPSRGRDVTVPRPSPWLRRSRARQRGPFGGVATNVPRFDEPDAVKQHKGPRRLTRAERRARAATDRGGK